MKVRRLIVSTAVLGGFAAGALAAPAFAQPDEIVIHTPVEVHTLGQERIGDLGVTTFSCGNAWRDIVCDAVLNSPSETVYVGNTKRGGSVSAYEAGKAAPNAHSTAPGAPTGPDAVNVGFVTEVHTRGVDRFHDTPFVSLSCGTVPRRMVCDALQSETPQHIVVGNETHGASVRVVSGEGL